MHHDDVLLVVYDYGSLAPMRLASLAEANGCDLVYICAGSPHAREMRPILEMTGTVIELAGRAEADVLRELEQLKPAGIVTFSEYQIARTAGLARSLGLAYHAPDDVPAITRKDAQRARFSERGVDALRYRAVDTPDQIFAALEYVGLPAIVKPVLGASSRNTFVVTDEDAGRARIAALLRPAAGARNASEKSVVLEELLVGRPTDSPWGDYIAVDCAASGADVRPVFVTSKFALCPPFRERGGYGARSVVPADELVEIRELACRAVRALDICQGIADVEIKLTEQGPRVIEVNGRLGGWVDDLAVRSGHTDPGDIAVKSALGRAFDGSQPPVPERIAFHYLMIPPPAATAVRSIRDVSSLRRLDFVETATMFARPGQAVDWSHGTASSVGAVLGATDTHDELSQVIDQIENGNWVTYD
jgi:predicted ATP-grasp superfamily ATP-dependent carboligase